MHKQQQLFDLKVTAFTLLILCGIVFFALHSVGWRNEKFGIFHELIDFLGNKTAEVTIEGEGLDMGEWKKIDPDSSDLTPTNVQ